MPDGVAHNFARPGDDGESASSLPVVLLAPPAGAMADILDRPRILLASQFWMMAVAALLTVLASSGKVSLLPLLVLTAASALGNATMRPAAQAVIGELGPSSELISAVTRQFGICSEQDLISCSDRGAWALAVAEASLRACGGAFRGRSAVPYPLHALCA